MNTNSYWISSRRSNNIQIYYQNVAGYSAILLNISIRYLCCIEKKYDIMERETKFAWRIFPLLIHKAILFDVKQLV